MRLSSVSSPICLLALASLVLGEAASDVLKLTSANFDETVKQHELMLVEFFAPWCGHCKALAPHYEEAATALKEKNISLANVDCVDQADLCQTHEVQGYPTLKVYKNGVPTEYNGPRKADGIISYMVKQSLPAVSEVTATNHEEFTKADKLVVVAYLPSTTSLPAPEFSAVAEKHRDDYLFGLTTDAAAAEAAGVSVPGLAVYRAFDEPQSIYPYPIAAAKSSDIADWLTELAIPVIDEVSGENFQIYATSPKPLAYLFLDPTAADAKAAAIDAIRPVAKKYKSKVNFVWIDAIKFGDHAKALNLPEAKWPAFVVQNIEAQLKYPLDQEKEVTPQAVDAWVEQYLAGKIEPTLRSQPVPEKQDDAVYTIVGKSFEDVVFDDSKDVFVEFYASWCGHCKRLAPVWENLAENFADRKGLLIAKFEAPENDLPPSIPFRISGFPTLKFKPAGSREFVDYEGDRSLDSLTAFIEEHAKNPLTPVVVAEPEPEAQVPITNNASETEDHAAAAHDEL